MPVLERVAPEDGLRRVQEVLGDKLIDGRVNFGQVDITCAPENLVEVVTALRDAPELRCEFFTFLSGVDRSEFGGADRKKDDETGEGGEAEDPGDLEVLIHVYSPEFAIHVNVHVPVGLDDPTCPSITSVYRGANWHERETHEMFGIDFAGHPHLRGLYLPEDFEGHPMRKSFRLPSRFIKEWPGAKDPEEAAAGGR
ncbi:MAG: NADH-quinone oxidoreductase subunit C [Actinomycetota bacterium]